MHTYSIFGWDKDLGRYSIKAPAIVAALQQIGDEEACKHLGWIAQLQERGCRYSNEDFDVLSSAASYARKQGVQPERRALAA